MLFPRDRTGKFKKTKFWYKFPENEDKLENTYHLLK